VYFIQYKRTLTKRPLSIIEVCFPDPVFVVHLGDELLMMHQDRNLSHANISSLNSDKDKIQMVGALTQIVFIDGSDKIFIFDLDLKYVNTVRVSNGEDFILINSLAYNETDDTFFAFELNKGIHKFDNRFKHINFWKLTVDKSMILAINVRLQILYFAVTTNGTLGRYFFNNESSIMAQEPSFADLAIVSFFVDNNDFLYSIYGQDSFAFSFSQVSVALFGGKEVFNSMVDMFSDFVFGLLSSENYLILSSLVGDSYEVLFCS
jgi:hypothetical protein